ncbi:MAG: TIGR00730 family Rossman fold protein [Candidatus Jacksonbacteria bacterium]|nr:TIGR00730 family Rossman fold protein [Candidatus Jacksonbacteria bacterium]
MVKKKAKQDARDAPGFSWRIFRIMAEFVDGFEFLTDMKRTVTFFGSARTSKTSKHYQQAVSLAEQLSKAGFNVITGGGPGIMEAANKGASKGKGGSAGLNIQLPFEQRMNKYVKRGLGFHYFFTRKVILSYSAQAYVYFPGGFGTLDEFFEIVTLIQTKKMDPIPIILIGKDYWNPLIAWIKETVLLDHKAIDPEDLNFFMVTDDIKKAFRIIKKSKERPPLFSE